MIKITIDVEGMACGMCEAHINDAVRQNFPVTKVTSSHSKGITEIIAHDMLDEERLKSVITATGYTEKAYAPNRMRKMAFRCFIESKENIEGGFKVEVFG